MPTLPHNPLADADIFSLDDVQIQMAPVGCRNPYVRYVSRKPKILQTNLSLLAFSEIYRFPTLGYTHFSAEVWLQVPPGFLSGYAHYYFSEKRDKAPDKIMTGGTVSPPYDVATDETKVAAKDIALYMRSVAVSNGAVLVNFSVLLEP